MEHEVILPGTLDRSLQILSLLKGGLSCIIAQCFIVSRSCDRGDYANVACSDAILKHSPEFDDPASAGPIQMMFTLDTLVFWHIKIRLCQMVKYNEVKYKNVRMSWKHFCRTMKLIK
jgi:hypothetical protein